MFNLIGNQKIEIRLNYNLYMWDCVEVQNRLPWIILAHRLIWTQVNWDPLDSRKTAVPHFTI